ncbi:MAG: hypothetical protein R2751_05110 [Bacteroidales bacterium]
MKGRKPFLPALMLSLVVIFSPGCRKSDYSLELINTITDQGGGTGTTTWTRDKEYVLNGFVFVNDGQTLTIEAGTVVRGRTGQGSLASALIVARGGKIIAEGSQTQPIVFTVEGDDLEGSVPVESRGLWGGLILLGNAPIHTETGEDMIEGIPVSEPRGVYGGPDEDDNSGILRYVSIRHGGTNIGEGNEINGLTLGGVGRQTLIDHVEVISNADDGVEFFGGLVNCSNLVVAGCGDDAYDIDQGYAGKGQFWVAVEGEASDHCLEISGGTEALANLPGAWPVLHNLTFVGEPGSQRRDLIHFGHFGGGFILNSILLHPEKGTAVRYSDLAGDSWALFESGDVGLYKNLLFPGNETLPLLYAYADDGSDRSAENTILSDSLIAWGTRYDDPGLSVDDAYRLLPPSTEFPDMAAYENSWFEPVSFKGAFGSNNWVEGWTLVHEAGWVNP